MGQNKPRVTDLDTSFTAILLVQFGLLVVIDKSQGPVATVVLSIFVVSLSWIFLKSTFYLMIASIFFTTNLDVSGILPVEVRLWYVLLLIESIQVMLRERRNLAGLWNRFRNYLVWSVGCVCVALLSYAAAPDPDSEILASSLITLGLSLMGFLQAAIWIARASFAQRNRTLHTLILVPALIVGTRIIELLFPVQFSDPSESLLTYPLGKSNQLAVVFLISFLVLTLVGENYRHRWILVVITVYGVASSGSRAATIALIAFFATYAISAMMSKRFRPLRQIASTGSSVFVGFLLSIISRWIAPPTDNRVSGVFGKSWSVNEETHGIGLANTRVDVWLESWDLFIQHPLTGVGLRHAPEHLTSLGHAHSVWVTVAIETGLIGMIATTLLLVHHTILLLRGRPGGSRLLISAAALAVAFCLSFYSFWDFQILWIVLGASLGSMLTRSSSGKES